MAIRLSRATRRVGAGEEGTIFTEAPTRQPAPGGGRKREEFARCALPHMDQVYTAGRYLTRNKEEAEDLLQETFLRAYRFWHQFTPGTNCKAWLITILHNNFKNRYRDRYREQQTVEFDEAVYGPESAATADLSRTNPEELVFSQLLDDEMERALQSLPVEFLETVVLVDIQELTYEEAASVLGCPIGTIRSRLSRGRQLLHAALRQYARERGYGRRGTYALR
jgi:RNA polymerase sigma-70 factor, ECF subfamily